MKLKRKRDAVLLLLFLVPSAWVIAAPLVEIQDPYLYKREMIDWGVRNSSKIENFVLHNDLQSNFHSANHFPTTTFAVAPTSFAEKASEKYRKIKEWLRNTARTWWDEPTSNSSWSWADSLWTWNWM
ncbi:hypothetical protein IE53DRAFT_360061 [Violaceomyces palustris]|uniref:Uncharacterized protein n=1 Tax=Violaceomyces palustris TaxID=1673888 RepID=A0ACD0P5N6_9BASI|nr:hypothetical protein IE53DRAFT_360061 [Violaceomyces palustris]